MTTKQTVLIWRSYGDIQVYAMDTCAQHIAIIRMMVAVLRSYHMDFEASVAEKFLQTKFAEHSIAACRNTINDIIEAVGSDGFQDCYFSEVRQ